MFKKLKAVWDGSRYAVKKNENTIEAKYIHALQVLEIKPGDIVILKAKIKLSSDEIAILKQCVEEYIRKVERDISVFVLDEGMDIGVLRKSAYPDLCGAQGGFGDVE